MVNRDHHAVHFDDNMTTRTNSNEDGADQDEPDVEEEDGIQLGLLSRKPREHVSDSYATAEPTTRQLAVGILAEADSTQGPAAEAERASCDVAAPDGSYSWTAARLQTNSRI